MRFWVIRAIATLVFCLTTTLSAPPTQPVLPTESVHVAGLTASVEVLRDRWGVPHIYAKNQDDLFFAQGFITAQDRLFQIDLWRRIGTGKLAEALGPAYVARDRIARLVRYRGNWDDEWQSYAPDAKQIATAFTKGINAYIASLNGRRPMEFQAARFDPGLWAPEDVTARVAGLLMTGNMTQEVNRSLDVNKLGLAQDARLFPPDPSIPLLIPAGLNLADITANVVKDYITAVGAVHFPGEQGSNNWVVDGTMTRSGKPLLANDPHRGIELPSLRKTVHLVAPGWNVIGAGEPALPGVALGHNENVAWGFTIVGIDQQDLYVEKVNPEDAAEYKTPGGWTKFTVETATIDVKGAAARTVELKYTGHGPVLYEDAEKHRAYALRWVGSEAGGAGYLPALKLARADNWEHFLAASSTYKIPSENLVYADQQGNIGWIAAGGAPIRQGWSGMFPVPGDTGVYEWAGLAPILENPREHNPARHYIATANNNILPAGYPRVLSYSWAPPTRYQRIVQMLGTGKKFGVSDFETMQQDTISLPAREFLAVLRQWRPAVETPAALVRTELIAWNGDIRADSKAALLYEVWIEHIHNAILPAGIASTRLAPDVLLRELKRREDCDALLNRTLDESLAEIRKQLGPDEREWKWGRLHHVEFAHPLGLAKWKLPPDSRPGDAYTVNATGGPNYLQTHGASYREILDLSDWDASVMTNVPGESAVPTDRHYGDLREPWAEGKYHPMLYSRKAVEAATEERILLEPVK